MPEKVSGYREQPQEVVDLVNFLKGMEEHAKIVTDALQVFVKEANDPEAGRWVSLAATKFEEGFMFAVKAAMRPIGGIGRRSPAPDADVAEPARRALDVIRSAGSPKSRG